jgi:phosphate transport system protein
MEKHFFHELDALKTNIIRMATLVDNQVDAAFEALEKSDIHLCSLVINKDKEIDAYDNLIQTQTENILALFQPVATDLRTIMTALMINNQLERCGDIAVNIVQRIKKSVSFQGLIEESDIFEMGKIARQMLKDAIDSFINSDSKLAQSVLTRDDTVDALNKKVFKFLIEKMESSPQNVKPGSHLLILSRNIERLADHATNISEDVIFMVDSLIVAHQKKLLDQKPNKEV